MLNSNKRLRIDHLIHMSEEAPPTLDDLMDNACDLLDSCRDRGIDIGPEAKMLEIAIEARNSARLEKLIARITAKIQKSDAASIGASSASLGSAAIEPYTSHSLGSAAIEPYTSSVAAESPNSIPTYNAGLPSLATLPAIPCNSGIPTLPAIPEFPRRRRGPKPRGPRIHLVTGGPSSPDCGHEPSSSHSCKHEAFRLYAYTTGKRHQEEGRLGEITFKQIIDDYVAANPGNVLPKSIAQSLQWDTLKGNESSFIAG